MRIRKWLCQSCCSPGVLSAADLAVLGKNFCSHPFLLEGFVWSQRILALSRMSAALLFAVLCVVCSCPPEQRALTSLSELLFPGWEISACCSRYISVPEALKKTKGSFTCRSLQPWKMRKSTELGIRPTSQQNYFPLCPLCFTWCSWMSLKRLLKQLFPKFLLFSSWTISIGGFL